MNNGIKGYLMQLYNYYKKGFIIPAGFVLTGYLVFVFIYIIFGIGRNYKSEWLDANSIVVYSLLIVFANSLLFGLLSLGIFLNTYDKIRKNRIYHLMSWFLLPVIWTFYLITKHFGYLQEVNFMPDEESLFIFSNTLPYLIGLAITYRHFNRDYNIRFSRKQMTDG